MAVSGTATSYNLTYLVGDLFNVATNEAPFLGMLGGLGGGPPVFSKQFPWQTVTNRSAAQTVVVEGYTQTGREEVRTEVYNVCEIHQERIDLTFTQQASTGQVANAAHVLGIQPVQSEDAFQTQLALERMASDIDYSFFNGSFVDDTDINTARKTRGVLTAATTNLVTVSETAPGGTTLSGVTATASTDVMAKTAHGLNAGDEVEVTAIGGGAAGLVVGTSYFVISSGLTADAFKVSATRGGATIDITTNSSGGDVTFVKRNVLTSARVDKLIRQMWTSGAKFRMPVIFCGAFQKQKLGSIYGFAPMSRDVGGVSIETIDTIAGPIGVKLVRNVPADRLAIVDVSVCKPRFLYIPPNAKTGRAGGDVIMYPLSRAGSVDSHEIYCEVGLEYGPEQWHGQLDGLATDEALA